MANRTLRAMIPCNVDGCAAPVEVDDMCGEHWWRWKRYGNATLRKDRRCDVEGCESPQTGRGLCGKHYQRFVKYGSTDPRPRPARLTCVETDCEKIAVARGKCTTHYARWKREGVDGDRAPCSYPGCNKNAVALGHCQMHRRQVVNGQALTPLAKVVVNGERVRSIRDEDGNKLCMGCNTWLPVTSFGVARTNVDGLTGYCKTCRRIVGRKSVLRFYKLTPEQFGARIAEQGGACAVCRLEFDRTPHVDHDHSCCPTTPTCGACTRGILCHSCNVAIGLMRDDPERLIAAAAYLTSPGASGTPFASGDSETS